MEALWGQATWQREQVWQIRRRVVAGEGRARQKLFYPGTVGKSPVRGISQNNLAGVRRAAREMDGKRPRGRVTTVPKKGHQAVRGGVKVMNTTWQTFHSVLPLPQRPPIPVPMFTLPTAAEACSLTCPHPGNHGLNKSNKPLGGPDRMYRRCVHQRAVTMLGYCHFQSKCLVCLERWKKVSYTFPCERRIVQTLLLWSLKMRIDSFAMSQFLLNVMRIGDLEGTRRSW